MYHEAADNSEAVERAKHRSRNPTHRNRDALEVRTDREGWHDEDDQRDRDNRRPHRQQWEDNHHRFTMHAAMTKATTKMKGKGHATAGGQRGVTLRGKKASIL